MEGLAKIVHNRESTEKSAENARVSELKRAKTKSGNTHDHVLSDSDTEDVSSDEEPENRDCSSGDESDNNRKKEQIQENEQKSTELVSDNVKLLQDLRKEFERPRQSGTRFQN